MPRLLNAIDSVGAGMKKIDNLDGAFKLGDPAKLDDMFKKLDKGFDDAGLKGLIDDAGSAEFLKKDGVDWLKINGKEIRFKDLDDMMFGSSVKRIGPDTAGLYKKLSKSDVALDDALFKKLKKTDEVNFSKLKSTDQWKHTTELGDQADLARKLDEVNPIRKNATPAETLEAIEKNSKQLEDLENVVKKISDGKKSNFGKFITAAKVAGAGLTVALLVEAIKKHQENMNGCWVVNTDDERECYKIRRDDRCDSGCHPISAYERGNKDKVNNNGYLKKSGTVEHDLLWSNCPPGALKTLGELCCNGTCGVDGEGTSCAEDGDEIDFTGKDEDLTCKTSKTCPPNWQKVIDDYDSTCPYSNLSGYKIDDVSGIMVSTSGSKDCVIGQCNPSTIRIIQLEGDNRIFSVQCKDVGFWDAATDLVGIDDLADLGKDILGFITDWGPTILIVVAVLIVLSVFGWIASQFGLLGHGDRRIAAVDIDLLAKKTEKPPVTSE